MKTAKTQLGLRQTILALSLLAAFGAVHADDEEDALAALASPDSSISVGIISASGNSQDRALSGQYNGLRAEGAKLQLEVDINRRDDETGTWTQLQGSNLGLDNREMRASYNKQGDWRISASYNALVHNDPRTLNSGIVNGLSATPTIATLAKAGGGTDINLSTKREGLGLGGGTWLTPQLLLELDFKNETKEGARLSSRGIACGAYSNAYNVCGAAAGAAALLASTTGAYLLVPEPVSSTIKQIDARLSYADKALRLNGGYYGSFYTSGIAAQSLTVGGNLVNPDGSVLAPGGTLLGMLQAPSALAPANEAHQFYLGGSYALSSATRANFKYAYTHATQNAGFVGTLLAGSPASLAGEVNNTLAQVGLTSRVSADLSVLANARYDSKDDRTPVAPYYTAGSNTYNNTPNAKTYYNTPSSSSKFTSKLEASYRLPENVSAIVGLDYQSVLRNRPAAGSLVDGISGLRENTTETGYRAELRRSMSDSLNASLGLSRSKRDGSSWLSLGAGNPAVADAVIYNANGVFPTTLEDRQRDKARLAADWTPMADLSLQFNLESGTDSYSAPTTAGLRDSVVRSYGVDAAWKISDNWKLTAYLNQGTQTLHVNQSGYLAELANTADNVAIGIVGSPASKYEVGASVSYLNDRNRYLEALGSGLAVVGGGLPDVNYRSTGLKLFGKYAIEKNADVRLDLMYQSASFDQWTWGSSAGVFSYSDNSSVSLQPNQDVTFIGVSYIYKMK